MFQDICCSIADVICRFLECGLVIVCKRPFKASPQRLVLVHTMPGHATCIVMCTRATWHHMSIEVTHLLQVTQNALQSAIKACTFVLEVLFLPHEPQNYRVLDP